MHISFLNSLIGLCLELVDYEQDVRSNLYFYIMIWELNSHLRIKAVTNLTVGPKRITINWNKNNSETLVRLFNKKGQGKITATGGITTGIGVYYNPDINKFWVIDYRIFSPEHDGATKVEHLY